MMNGDELNTLIDLPRKSTCSELRRAQFTAVKIIVFYEGAVKYLAISGYRGTSPGRGQTFLSSQ